MKKVALVMFLMVLLPTLVFAVSNAKLNGQKEVTITQLPVDLVFTCDLAGAGNKIAVEYYVDLDMNGAIGPQEMIVEFFYLTDGIGWIKDPNDSDNDFAGDETGVDGKIKTTFTIEAEDVFIPVGMSGIIKIIDEDGSTDMLSITLQLEPQPPFIQGKITDKNTGSPIQNIFVIAENEEESRYAVSDGNGDYKISVSDGTYDVFAMEFPMVNYQPSDTVSVVVSGESQTVNIQMEPYTSFVEGKLTYEDGSPVPGIMILAMGDIGAYFFSTTITDDQGNYRMGVESGQVVVSPSALVNSFNDNWPQDYYPDPEADTLNVSPGQTVTANFVFKPYTSFVTGKCTADDAGLPGVRISAFAFDMQTFSMKFYTALTDQDGNYRLGVLPGTLTSLTATIEGYELVSPVNGYMQVNVPENQTVTGKDFEFRLLSNVTKIAGTVTFTDGSPAQNVYVAAENWFEESPDGFLIAYTDNSGYYEFINALEGDYHLGVYLSGYSSDPPMREFYLPLESELLDQDFVLQPGTGVKAKDRILKPITIHLAQNYPNPFNPITTIKFELPEPSEVEISIFNAAGQKIRTLVSKSLSAGEHRVEWNGKDDFGRKVASGIYLYQLKTEKYNKVMKMIFAK